MLGKSHLSSLKSLRLVKPMSRYPLPILAFSSFGLGMGILLETIGTGANDGFDINIPVYCGAAHLTAAYFAGLLVSSLQDFLNDGKNKNSL